MSQIVDFLPYSDVEPPTNLSAFPDEFVVKTTSAVRKHALIRRSIGDLQMSTHEPLPLAYSPYQNRPLTQITLSITASGSLSKEALRALSLNVKPFYASEPMSCLPKQTALARRHSMRLRDEVVKLDPVDIAGLDWKYQTGGHMDADEPPGYADSVADGPSRYSISNTHAKSNNGEEMWRAILRIPIQRHETLHPTFCASLISRSYSVVMRVGISGFKVRKADLEIPLQVVYLQAQQGRNDSVHDERSGSCLGPEALLAQSNELPRYHGR